MKFRLFLLLPSLAALALHSTSIGHAQGRETSAREALDLVSVQFGPRAVQWVAEMHATRGMPQPSDWAIMAYDDRLPQLLYRFRAGGGRAGDAGPEENRYPIDIPIGYFSPNQIGVDSVAAFTIAEGEARKAQMAFDSCDYLLRVREFSTEPLWRLELFDANRRIVGKIYISASSGAVLRTMWVYRDHRARPDGLPRVVDSYAPTSRPAMTGITGDDYPAMQPVPGGEAGIVQMGPPSAGIPGEGRMATIPVPPAPGGPVASGPQPFRPVSPDGTAVDSGIPDPPATTPDPPAAASPPASTGQMPDLRTDPPATSSSDPTRPPIEVPSGGGSSGRIPPPPIPR